MSDERPVCSERDDESQRTVADCAEHHTERWFHAKDAMQVERWIMREDREVFDTDGDRVHNCNPVHPRGDLITYAISAEGACAYSLHFTNFLLEGPDFELVTEDEEAAVIASILRTTN